MDTKHTELIIPPVEPHFVGDGFRVHNFIPGAFRMSMERMDPFILMDYNSKFYFPPSDTPRGVGVHPHRGFETVTIAYKGKVAHHDSAGNSGVIGEGDVQWMTAASGILHKEYHEAGFSKMGGNFQMVQLWVNLPAKDKMSAPKYQGITRDQIPKFQLPDKQGEVEVIAGKYQDVEGAATTFSPIHLLNVRLEKDAEANFSFPSHFHTALLVIEGEVKINDAEDAPVDHLVVFENQGEAFVVRASEKSVVLVLSGEPLNEPIASHGPFVMNTREELLKAFQDFNSGKFGYLAD